MNPQTDIPAISADQAREVARINNISMDDAYSRIGRAQASQSGQMRGAEGTYYNPATGERGTNIFTIGRDPSYWGGASMSDRATGTYPSGTVPTVPTAGSVSPSSVGPGMTIGSIYGGTGSALSAYQGRLGALSQPVDEEGIRRAAVDRVQSEIDAMNRFYAEKTRQEKEVARQVGESSLAWKSVGTSDEAAFNFIGVFADAGNAGALSSTGFTPTHSSVSNTSQATVRWVAESL